MEYSKQTSICSMFAVVPTVARGMEYSKQTSMCSMFAVVPTVTRGEGV